jgi:hypothetical protein
MTIVMKLLQRLSDPAKSGVYRVPDEGAVREALVHGQFDFAVVELATGKEEMLASIARSLGFPEWFGGNWDALEDCLTDLSWRDGANHVILFKGAVDSDDLGVLLDVLSSAAEFWRERNRAFFAVFVDPEGNLKLPSLYKARSR